MQFRSQAITAVFTGPDGTPTERLVEVRTCPVSGRTSRITFSRLSETEPGTEQLPPPPPGATQVESCPFCPPQLWERTPRFAPDFLPAGRLRRGRSVLFPNLFPYGRYSAVSLFGPAHFVEIGRADADEIADAFINSGDYLKHCRQVDPEAVFLAVTQNHLPSAGGSLIHPHLQVHADRIAGNHHRFFQERAARYRRGTGCCLFSDLLARERAEGDRLIGATGQWQWLAAFAPEGFFEIWAILEGHSELTGLGDDHWRQLAEGVVNAQRFYRHLNRNGYNFGLLAVEDGQGLLALRAVMRVRSNYAPWVRSDFTGYELMLGDMATFVAPESVAQQARPFWVTK
jgi:UDPglucose--hexose-1-phosphate uridylyltransferase